MTRFSAIATFVALFLGCGPGDGRLPVSGTVTLNGQNLGEGTIEFFNDQTRTGAQISEGKYSVERDQGLTPGKYKVSITSGDGRTPADDPEAAPGPTVRISFRRNEFQLNTTLKRNKK